MIEATCLHVYFVGKLGYKFGCLYVGHEVGLSECE